MSGADDLQWLQDNSVACFASSPSKEQTDGHVERSRASTIGVARDAPCSPDLSLEEWEKIAAHRAAALARRAVRQVRDAEMARLGAKVVTAVADAAFWRQAEVATMVVEMVAELAEIASLRENGGDPADMCTVKRS
jgi:hypothetical protein